jgi:hypothetical protein
MVRRIDRFMQHNEVDGVDVDARVVVNETEAVRLSIVSQLLAYTELYKVTPTPRVRQDITDRADDLIDRFDAVRSGTVFDGMLGYALLEAYARTSEPRYLDYGRRISEELLALPRSQRVLNGGLMGAMALADDVVLTGDTLGLAFVDDVLANLRGAQNPDGSFPHWCLCSTDIHYTDWMATELILIQRLIGRPEIEPMLERMYAFLESRVDAHGVTQYVDSCSAYPGCVIPYYSIASGCGIDYDTRAWTNELGYSALLFDHFDSPAYGRVMRFMKSLEHGGVIADKWDFWPPADDPYFVWADPETSVINTSLIFWSLSSVLSGRHARAIDPVATLDGPDPEPAVAATPVAPLRMIGEVATRRRRRDTVDSLLVAGADASTLCAQDGAPRSPAPALGPPPIASAAATTSSATRREPGGGRSSMRLEVVPGAGAGALRFVLPAGGIARLVVYDTGGRRVRGLLEGTFEAGEHRVVWDGRDDTGRACPSGVYFAALRSDTGGRASRIMLVR